MAEVNPFNLLSSLPQLQAAEKLAIPLPPTLTRNPAEWMHERLVRSIVEFEKSLDEAQEIGARLVNFSEREPIHISDVGFWGPDLIIFYGTNADGRSVQLLQHVTQVSVLLVALPKEHQQARRIGFQLQKRLDPGKDGS